MKRLNIICGHGGVDTGAINRSRNITEKDMTRLVGRELHQLGGEQVVLLDTSIDWYSEKKCATYPFTDDDYVLELHLDASDNTGARGGHVIITNKFPTDEFDLELSKVCDSYFDGRSRLIDSRNDLYNMNILADRCINYRLLEMAFITSNSDMQKFLDDKYRQTYEKAILKAFGIQLEEVAPDTPQGSTGDDMGDSIEWLDSLLDDIEREITNLHRIKNKIETRCY